jgi:hypothetical protein
MTRRRPGPTSVGVLVEEVASAGEPPRKKTYRASVVWGVNPLFVQACEAGRPEAAVEGLEARLRGLGYEPNASVFGDLEEAREERRRRDAALELLVGSFDERARDRLALALGDGPAAEDLYRAFEELRNALAAASRGLRPGAPDG